MIVHSARKRSRLDPRRRPFRGFGHNMDIVILVEHIVQISAAATTPPCVLRIIGVCDGSGSSNGRFDPARVRPGQVAFDLVVVDLELEDFGDG